MMAEREKVIAGLSSIHAVALDSDQLYINHMGMKEFNGLIDDALELLEAVKPVRDRANMACGNCGKLVGFVVEKEIEPIYNYCPKCGKKVAWDE